MVMVKSINLKTMKRLFNTAASLSFTALLACCTPAKAPHIAEITIQKPEDLYGQLFYDVQSNQRLFADRKTFVDCVPRYDVAVIREKYAGLSDKSDSSMMNFLRENFEIPGNDSHYKADSTSANEHIVKLWEVLKRPPNKPVSGTLIPLPYPYIVPGDRFREVYYWDSYFTMLGLQADNQVNVIRNMIDNFSYLIDTLGYIPNGNRTYYLGRSQPPFYAAMVTLLAESEGDSVYLQYQRFLEKEYTFWMDGATKLNDTLPSYRRVVRLPGGEILNRYWDDNNTPRAESYLEDINTANEAVAAMPGVKREDVLRNLRAAAESGWDFCSRWLSPDNENILRLYTIHTTDIVPIDLNSLLYNLEYILSRTYEMAGDKSRANEFKAKCESRRAAVVKYCWSKQKGFFMDYNFKAGAQTDVYSLAGLYPLYFHLSDQAQSVQVAKKIKDSFLKDGGVLTTLNNTGEQWDAPNGWAPLEWMTIKGLRNYGHDALAGDIRKRWLALNEKIYNGTYKFIEKYNVEDLSKEGGGGEYPNQDGFGWSNGVFQKLSREAPPK